MVLEKEFLEIIGLYIGDGTIYKNKNSYVFELRGNIDEKDFYETYIKHLFEKYLKAFSIVFRSGGKNGCYGIRTCNQEFILNILKLGFESGSKTSKIKLSKSLMDLSIYDKKYLIRGLFAADGTAYKVKINSQTEKNYPLIEYSTKSNALIKQISKMLLTLKIRHYTWTYNNKRYGPQYHLRISGIKECTNFQETIGLINPKQLSRIRHLLHNSNI
jgi:intein/homing endonuclease